jgi:FlaA1/EpsC-like NDP-sugar epimerase
MNRRTGLLLWWLATDLGLFILIYLASYFLRVGLIFSSDLQIGEFVLVVIGVAPFWLLSLIATRTFGLTRSQGTPRNFFHILASCVVGAALVALAFYFVHARVFSRLLLFIALALSVLTIWLWHLCFEQIQRRLLRRQPVCYPTAIVGLTRESKRLIESLQRSRHPLTPVAIFDAQGTHEKHVAGVPVVGRLHKLESTMRAEHITHVIQCSDLEHSINILSICRSNRVTYLLLPSVLGIVEGTETIEFLEHQPVAVVAPNAQSRLLWPFR